MKRNIKNNFALVFQTNFHLLEYRKTMEKLIYVWPDVLDHKEGHWKNTFLPLGQISCGLGFQIAL